MVGEAGPRSLARPGPALTPPHLRGLPQRLLGTSGGQSGQPGLPLPDDLHAAGRVDLEQLRDTRGTRVTTRREACPEAAAHAGRLCPRRLSRSRPRGTRLPSRSGFPGPVPPRGGDTEPRWPRRVVGLRATVCQAPEWKAGPQEAPTKPRGPQRRAHLDEQGKHRGAGQAGVLQPRPDAVGCGDESRCAELPWPPSPRDGARQGAPGSPREPHPSGCHARPAGLGPVFGARVLTANARTARPALGNLHVRPRGHDPAEAWPSGHPNLTIVCQAGQGRNQHPTEQTLCKRECTSAGRPAPRRRSPPRAPSAGSQRGPGQHLECAPRRAAGAGTAERRPPTGSQPPEAGAPGASGAGRAPAATAAHSA